MSPVPQLEDYLAGRALTPELARLQAGEDPETIIAEAIAPAGRDLREIDDDDREHLKRLSTDAGWAVLLRLLDRQIQNREDSVKAFSKVNPLANRDQIAEQWAYLGILAKVRQELVLLLDVEIAKLK